MKFRNDIEGLRGIAVMLVVLSHLEIPRFEGGFIGVDIFFVISGFLITSMICNEYTSSQETEGGKGSFSLTSFYLRRIKRIIPLSLFVLVSTSVASYLLFNSARFDRILTDSIWAAFFAANIRFISLATDYFQQGFAVSPIQHYWSLAVEEQFYVFFPVLLFLSTRIPGLRILGHRVKENHRAGLFIGYRVKWNLRAGLLIGLITAISLLWSVTQTSANPTSSYFSSLTRAWEIGIGGLVAVLILKFKYQLSTLIKAGLAVIGLELILLATLRFDSTTPFPGIAALIPVGGAAFVIFAGSSGTNVVTAIVGNKVLTFIGRISFSLYLWHWPLIVIVKSTNPTFTEGLIGKFALLACMFVLSFISFKIVEQPFRKMQFRPARRNREKSERNRAATHKFVSFAIPTVLVLVIGSLYVGMSRYLDAKNDSALSITVSSLTTSVTSIPKLEGSYAELLAAWQTKIADGIRLTKVPADMKPSLRELPNTGYGIECRLSNQGKLPPQCSFGNSNAAKTAIIFGDSFAMAIYPMLNNALDLQEWHIIPITMPVCMIANVTPWVDGSPFTRCVEHRDRAFELIDKIRPDLLILADNAGVDISENGRQLVNRNQAWLSGLSESMSRLTKSATKTIYFGSTPGGNSLVDCVNSDETISNACFYDSSQQRSIRYSQSQIMKGTSNLYIDPTNWMCRSVCPPIIDNTPVFWDGSHFTPEFAEKLAPLFRAFLKSNNLL